MTTDLRTALASGQPVKLQDLISARRVTARQAKQDALALVAAAQAAAEERVAQAQFEAKRAALDNADVEALKALGLHGVYLVCNDGGLSLLGGLSDMDTRADGKGEIVEVEYECGYRRWFDRAEVVLV